MINAIGLAPHAPPMARGALPMVEVDSFFLPDHEFPEIAVQLLRFVPRL